MKRIAIIFLVLILLLSGCNSGGNAADNYTVFYYLKHHDDKQPTADLIGNEFVTDFPNSELDTIIVRYLQGPIDPRLYCGYPSNTTLISWEETKRELIVTLSDACAYLQPLDITLSGICLAQTLFPYTEAERIVITAEGGYAYMSTPPVFTRDNIIQKDSDSNSDS